MPERDAATCNLGDGYLLIAAGLRREKSGDLTADLMLKNGASSTPIAACSTPSRVAAGRRQPSGAQETRTDQPPSAWTRRC